MPVFVPMHESRPPVARNGSLFTFVDSVDEALRLAREAAGEKPVVIMGSPNVAQQLLAMGQVDEISLHLTEVILGGGIRLFEDSDGTPIRLERLSILESTGITHLRYRVLN